MKINIAYSFIKKVLTLSNHEFHPKNKQIITHILLKNNYPSYLIKSLINKYINQSQNNNITRTIGAESSPMLYKSITYNKGISNIIIKTIKKNQNKNINIAYKIYNKMENIYTKLKDKIDEKQKHNIIYSIPCLSCSLIYIGQTKRSLGKRMQEHKYSVKNSKLDKDKTAIVTHYLETGHHFNYEEAKIIDHEAQLHKRLTLEACHIWKNENRTINFRTDLQNINSIYSDIIKTLTKQ